MLAWLSREPGELLDSVVESCYMGGLLHGRVLSIELLFWFDRQVQCQLRCCGCPGYLWAYTSTREGLRVDRCRRRSSTLGQVVTAVVLGHTLQQGGFEVGPGNGLERHENGWLGFGICVALGFDLEIHYCEWDFGAGGGKLMCIGHKYSLVLLYILPWASMM